LRLIKGEWGWVPMAQVQAVQTQKARRLRVREGVVIREVQRQRGD